MNVCQTLSQEKSHLFADACKVLLGGLFLSLFANISVPLPFTPVPLATQPHVALFLGAILGAKRGALAVLTFLVQGIVGLPVFAQAAGGWAAFLTAPRMGYLLGYMAAAYLVGWIVSKDRSSSLQLLYALIVGNLTIYLFGASYLALFLGVKSAILLGVLPFLIGDFVKTACIFKAISWMQRRFSHS